MFVIANIRPQGHNVGNHAINFALRHMLYEVFGRYVSIIEFPATNKHESTSKAGLSAATVHEINRFADGVIIGGGNLFENDELDASPVALNALQVPLMLFSNSRGRIFDRYGRLSERSDVIDDQKLAKLVDRSDISLSRDSATNKHIKLLNSKDQIGWCPTINMNRYKDLLPNLPDGEEVGALISIRTPNLMNIPFRFQSKVESHINLMIDRLREAGHKRVRILCNDSRDLDFASIFRFSKKADTVYTNDVYQYLSLLKNTSLLISYRLHATLPAISFGRPTINITYDERAQCLFDDLNLSNHYLDLVNLRDNFDSTLEERIEMGGMSNEDILLIQESWKKFSKFQFEALHDFKDLLTKYTSNGRALIDD